MALFSRAGKILFHCPLPSPLKVSLLSSTLSFTFALITCPFARVLPAFIFFGGRCTLLVDPVFSTNFSVALPLYFLQVLSYTGQDVGPPVRVDPHNIISIPPIALSFFLCGFPTELRYSHPSFPLLPHLSPFFQVLCSLTSSVPPKMMRCTPNQVSMGCYVPPPRGSSFISFFLLLFFFLSIYISSFWVGIQLYTFYCFLSPLVL